MVFASRRTVVDCEHLETILRDDGYQRIPREEARIGDLVVYRSNDIAKHVGVIYKFKDVTINPENPRWEIWVLSQWGEDGEYLHKMDEVPLIYGNQREFWSERRPVI